MCPLSCWKPLQGHESGAERLAEIKVEPNDWLRGQDVHVNSIFITKILFTTE